MNKRVLRKFAIPSSRPNPKNGIFCADQVKYVVRTAIKNIDHQRTLVLYIYAKESVLAGNHMWKEPIIATRACISAARAVRCCTERCIRLMTAEVDW